MGGLQSGGGTSAVAASAHAGCERFRLTDPFITSRTRRATATFLGFPDDSAGIPEARWMRAMTFEALVHGERFVSELLTRTVGRLGLPRPDSVRRRDCGGKVGSTAAQLVSAHEAAISGQATMLTRLAVPYVHLEHRADATAVQPDFAIVCPRVDGGSWLIMGDAKDYERIRSRIDDQRMLKGFLQVALGAESAEAWSKLPAGMSVHRSGALAVPRNAFLQPEPVVELLDDHRGEVRARAEERLAMRAKLGDDRPTDDELADFVAHQTAVFDPRSCVTCSLFTYCRAELRARPEPEALLTEIGVERHLHAAVQAGTAPKSVTDQVEATLSGLPAWSDRRRTDPAGEPGTIDVVVVKSDSAALGVHGVAVRSHPGTWVRQTFADPQSPLTRRAVMRLIGEAIRGHSGRLPVQLVVPDRPTADLLATAADSLAGVELSRLRWERDLEQGRPALTFDGAEATIPEPLHPDERLAVSFLLEEDRARAMRLRTPILDLRSILAAHVTAGGPAMDAGRLDYLVTWAEATEPLDHRAVSDAITAQEQTPGARLSNVVSDALHGARRERAGEVYEELVSEALDYRMSVVERAIAVLSGLPSSRLREVHRALEADAQEVWGRRLALQASDLVRFSRTYTSWRNAQVEMLDDDRTCAVQLGSLGDYGVAHDRAADAGVRELALATVTAVEPLRLRVRSRRLKAGTRVVALHVNGEAMIERASTTLKIQGGSFKFGQMAIGDLVETAGDELEWQPKVCPPLAVGDEIVLADAAWFGKLFKNSVDLAVARPSQDNQAAPKSDCGPDTYTADKGKHLWCCRPHAVAEAEWSDTLAVRRARGELNPDTWPPLVDEERFDVGGDAPAEPPASVAPAALTIDDLD
ncbi:hypothetical protein SAMN05216207_101544 [Pseudonocardia ammonioxydans]|uniref:Uncharacterized protein n=1 Tax=Pseudonocardia ammonioxydans TaxID=260086 RepID=A0A1I4ZFJ9_PSUAM|nr:hypothetical protein [Pseudonocardia ammonioxydans]SFN48759.1 hypothetical protein SAMN05216207_101544 [Pseudonocardia ammonioxydans]